MITINENYRKLHASYLFSDIAKRVADFQEQNHSGETLIKLGIGDVTLPLPAACIRAFQDGVNEMAQEESFHGYGPENGYLFLRERIAEFDFSEQGVTVSPDEIFISDGAKCDTGNIQEIFSGDVRVAVPDPVYPVYVDTNVMAGRTGSFQDGRYQNLLYLESTEENGFIPLPAPDLKADLIYLCFPNNPTGAVASKDQLKAWVDYARQNKALIIFDAAYEAFIRNPEVPHSIYEIEGAREVAIESRSFSKKAGFTGTRCAYLVIPRECRAFDAAGAEVSVRELWTRRHSTKFNGVSYPVQRAAAGIYTPEGKRQTRELVDYYLENARMIAEGMKSAGYTVYGGENSPYLWIKTPRPSWETFSLILNKAAVVTTPGAGFGLSGENYIRISAFNNRDCVRQAIDRIVSRVSLD